MAQPTPWYLGLPGQILLGMAAGVAFGALGGESLASRVEWLGALFVRLLKMVIVPLVFTSIIAGVASAGEGRQVGRLFAKTLGWYVSTSLLAIVIGLVLTNVIRPGAGATLAGVSGGEIPELETPTSIVDLFLDMVPVNVLDAASKPDMLGIIFFCVLFGIALAGLPERQRAPLLRVFESAFQAMMTLTGFVIRFAPLGVFGLLAPVVATSGVEAFRALGWYMATVAAGLTLHLFVALPLLLLLLGRIRPDVHFRNMIEPLTMAFSSASSGATLPVTLRAVETRVGVSNRVSSFVLPLGATVNMDGTALYECAGVLFIAQVLGADLSVGQQALVVLTALLASIGTAAVPSAGLVIIFLVLESVNLRGPEVDVVVGAMLAVDRPLDMFRTAVNVFSDSCGAAVIARSEGEAGIDAAVSPAG